MHGDLSGEALARLEAASRMGTDIYAEHSEGMEIESSRGPLGASIRPYVVYRIQARILSAGEDAGSYEWEEVALSEPDGEWELVVRSSETEGILLIERNGRDNVAEDSIVEAVLHESGAFYLFDAPAGASVVVSGVNSNHYYTSWTTEQLIFDAATVPNVWYISGDGVGPTTVTIRPAYADGIGGSAYPGVVTVDPQSFVGAKTFWDGVVAKEYTANYTSTSITFDVRGLSRTDGSSTEEIIFGDESTNGYIRLKKTVSSTWWQLTFGDVTPGGDGVNSTGLFFYSSNDATSNPGFSLKTIIHAGYFVAGTKYQVIEESGGYTTREGQTGFILPGAYAIGGIITNLGSSGSNGQIYIGNGSGFTLATLTEGNGIDITNGSGSITIAAATQMSITADGSGLKLSGDSATPGNNYFYGTDGSGTKGWYSTSGFGVTQEQVEDWVDGLIHDTDSIQTSYDDALNKLEIAVICSSNGSIISSGGIKLSGDSATPGNNYFYGTDGSGTKGWYSTSGFGVTQEQVEDWVNGLIHDTDSIQTSYDDALNKLEIAVICSSNGSIISSGGIKLDGDLLSPGNSKLYGTDSSGVKGWYDIPSGSSYTDENAQDAIGGILTDTYTISFTYSDSTPSISADIYHQMSLTADSNGIKLVNDTASPGNNKFYGTDGSGTRGWNALPAGLNYVTAPTYSDDSGSVGDYSVDATYVYFYLNGTWRRWAFDAGFGPAPP